MAQLKAVVETLDVVAEPLRALYVERDGKFVLDAEGVEDVTGLKSALERERQERRAAKEALRKLEGLDPEEYQRLKAEAEEREKKRAAGEGDFKALEVQLLEKHAKETERLGSEVKRYRAALEEQLVDAQAVTAIAAAKGRAKLLLPHVKAHVKVIEEDGVFVVRVVDERGQPRISPKGAGSAHMTIAELVEEMKASEDFGPAFEGSGASGSGAVQSAGHSRGLVTITQTDAADALKYRAAKKRAEEAGQGYPTVVPG